MILWMQALINEQFFIAIVSYTKIESNSIVYFVCVIGVRSNRWCIESFVDYWIDNWLRKTIPRSKSFNDVDFRRQFIC